MTTTRTSLAPSPLFWGYVIMGPRNVGHIALNRRGGHCCRTPGQRQPLPGSPLHRLHQRAQRRAGGGCGAGRPLVLLRRGAVRCSLRCNLPRFQSGGVKLFPSERASQPEHRRGDVRVIDRYSSREAAFGPRACLCSAGEASVSGRQPPRICVKALIIKTCCLLAARH